MAGERMLAMFTRGLLLYQTTPNIILMPKADCIKIVSMFTVTTELYPMIQKVSNLSALLATVLTIVTQEVYWLARFGLTLRMLRHSNRLHMATRLTSQTCF